MEKLHSIDLRLAERLKDREFRREWFRAELESRVPEMFRDMRELRKFTQSQLASLSAMKQSAISRFEKSRDANWKLETLIKLSEALDARLVITIEPAEAVIVRCAREEGRGIGQNTSVIDAVAQTPFNSEGNASVLSEQKKTDISASLMNVSGAKSLLREGGRRWN